MSLKWPEIARWLQWYNSNNGSITGHNGLQHEHEGIRKLEETLGSVVTNDREWLETVADKLTLDISKSPWIADEALRKFFRQEASEKDNDKRLASSIKNGFY